MKTIDIIRERFPGRATLTAEEVAAVLHGSTTRSKVQSVQEELASGILVPGLRKSGRIWRIPAGALADAIDSLVEPSPSTPKPLPALVLVRSSPVVSRTRLSDGPRRGRSPIGPKVVVLRLERSRAWAQEVIAAWNYLLLKDGVPFASTPSGLCARCQKPAHLGRCRL
jgi:hypothetical protein